VSLPTYFVSRSTGRAEALPPNPDLAIHALDSFFTPRLEGLVEWAIVVDGEGRLHALDAGQRSAFPSDVQAQLAFNEVARATSARTLDLAAFYLFDLDVAEQTSDQPGLNDPVYLYGTLCGPYGATVQETPTATEGQLTLTRTDLLEGIVRGADHAFRYAGPAGRPGAACRCFHLMLPADREQQIQTGHGIALAYPLLPAALLTSNPANEIVMNQLVFDMLTALKNDATKSNEENPLRTQLLPVPSRSLLEQELVKQGFRIEGNAAVKTPQATGMVGELLLAVFGDYVKKRVEIPPEATIDQFVDIARTSVAALRDWPSSRSSSLQARLKPPRVSTTPTPGLGLTPPPPQPPPAARRPAEPSGPPPRPRIYTPRKKDTPDWMEDFVAAHRQPGRPAPKLTRVDRLDKPQKTAETPKTAKKAKHSKPAWMKDFE
jgi:hypothetical protein